MKLFFQSAVAFVFFGGTKLLAETNSVKALQLAPPYGELPPTFWQRNAPLIFCASVFLILAIVGIYFLLRARPKKIIPPKMQARETLEKLRRESETGKTVSRVSQTVRNYFIGAFQLPAGEFTTAEFARVIANDKKIGAEISGNAIDFLRECDARKFSSSNEFEPMDAPGRALQLVEQAERRLCELAETQNQIPRA
jgi:hypothetical protein